MPEPNDKPALYFGVDWGSPEGDKSVEYVSDPLAPAVDIHCMAPRATLYYCSQCKGYTAHTIDGACTKCGNVTVREFSGDNRIFEVEIPTDDGDPFGEGPEIVEDADSLYSGFPTSPQNSFGIHDRDSADWLLKKLAGIDSERTLIKAQHEERLAQLKADETRLNNRFRAELDAFVKEEVKQGKRKSLVLPHGTLQVRSVGDTYKVTDEEEAIRHCNEAASESLNELVMITSELKKNEYKAFAREHMELTGELLPGVIRTEAHESVSIKFGSKTALSSEVTPDE